MRNIHAEFVKYGKNAKYWLRRCEMLLPEIAREEIWKKKRFSSIYEYAAKLAGMNHEKVNECLRIMKHIEDKPELLEVAREKGLGAVRPVVTIATKETAKFWAGNAITMKKNTLETYVRNYKAELRPSTDLNRLENVKMELDPKVADQLKKMKGDRDWNTFMKELMDGQRKPEPKKHVATKTNGICAHPDCNKPAVEFHHTKRFSLNHEHNPDQITPLCKAHHDLCHLGLIANEEKQPYEWQTNPKYEVDKLVQAYKTG
ncbi:MAG: hypothetical protein UV80_C0006G0018 [Candidatus Peregrinibacteria bacterium GW2011_GWF2_43_17]|nr:MAG: hypothetical protein UV80_C0006G0018 [Candidatus Peregrinibacteria bacterium GW2011_GWF2_43_17]